MDVSELPQKHQYFELLSFGKVLTTSKISLESTAMPFQWKKSDNNNLLNSYMAS